MSLDKVYHVCGCLGKGAYGAVYMARQCNTNTFFALKIAHRSLKDCCKEKLSCTCLFDSDDIPDVDRNVAVEIASLLRIGEHPHIVDMLTHGVWVNKHGVPLDGFVMPLASCCLTDMVKDAPRLDMAPTAAFQIYAALKYLHNTVQMAHCDVTLSNILVFKDFHLRLCDFGAARGVDKQGNIVYGENCCATTFTLASPQCALAYEFGAKFNNPFKCDVWAAGICVLAMCVSERLLFQDYTVRSSNIVFQDTACIQAIQDEPIVQVLLAGPLLRRDNDRPGAEETWSRLCDILS